MFYATSAMLMQRAQSDVQFGGLRKVSDDSND